MSDAPDTVPRQPAAFRAVRRCERWAQPPAPSPRGRIFPARRAEAFARIQKTQAAPKLAFLTRGAIRHRRRRCRDDHPGRRSFAGCAGRARRRLHRPAAERVGCADEATPGRAGWPRSTRRAPSGSRRRSPRPAAAQQVELLTEISAATSSSPQTPLDKFFKATKDATIRGYYTSEIGIHKELQYKGNQFLPEFVGCTHPEHGYVPSSK